MLAGLILAPILAATIATFMFAGFQGAYPFSGIGYALPLGMLYALVAVLLLGTPLILVLRFVKREGFFSYALAGTLLGAGLAAFIIAEISNVFGQLQIEGSAPPATRFYWGYVCYGALSGLLPSACKVPDSRHL